MKLLLIDGSSVLSTNFYGSLPWEFKKAKTPEEKAEAIKKAMKTSDGRFTNGVFGMTKALLKVLKKQKPDYIAVAWDVSRETFRRKLYKEYKGNRSKTPDALKSQFGLMQEVLDEMNIPQFKFEDFEADDIIGTFAKNFEEEVEVSILTKDQDALQLISERTNVWLSTSKSKKWFEELEIDQKEINIPDGTFEFTNQTFEKIYGLKPIQMIDKKALEGDASDNIPGVKGVGEKAVTPLLQRFNTIEQMYDFLETLDKTSEKLFKQEMKEQGASRLPLKKLLEVSDSEVVGKRIALLSKELATIKTDIELLKNVKLENLKVELDKEKTKRKFEELEFKSLIEKI